MAGRRIGPYEILEPIGSGGMGEVYHGRDTKLDRDVALKFLPASVATDPERLVRFRHEARSLAALNHSHIAQIYGLEESAETSCIAMELVRGETLAARLRRGPLPVAEALIVARQICEALEAAHAKGIVHRDLKPANVMITLDGLIKVLDFGLAKAIAQSGQPDSVADSPTRTALTDARVILGTAAYMSPEQARTAPTDGRTDVFSFGSVLYEMVTGTRAFRGETVTDIVASVLAREPDFNRLPANLHPDVSRLIRRCLDKNLRQRWQAIGDVRFEIDAILAAHPTGLKSSEAAAVRMPLWRRAVPLAIVTVAGGLVTAVVLWNRPVTSPRAPNVAVRRFAMPLDLVHPVISPDGQRIAYRFQDQLWIHDLSSDTLRMIQGGEGKGGYYNAPGYYLAWSPDSQSIAFLADDEVRRISLPDGSVSTICRLPETPSLNKRIGGLAWSGDGQAIVFSRYGKGIFEVSARGGEPKQIAQEEHADDILLLDTPQGRAILFATLVSGVHDLIARTPTGERRKVATLNANWPELVYSPTGHVLFRRNPVENPSIWALPFSAATLAATGDPFMVERSGQGMSLAQDGTLIYLDVGLGRAQTLAWRDRAGKILSRATTGHEQVQVARLSDDGARAVVLANDGSRNALWIYDTQRFSRTRFALGKEVNDKQVMFAFWLKGSDRIHYTVAVQMPSDLVSFVKETDATSEPLRQLFPKGFTVAQDATADARLIVTGRGAAGDNQQIWLWQSDGVGKQGSFVDFSHNTEPERAVTLSPNGRYVAYTSTISGRQEVHVRPVPDGPGRWQISSNEGGAPRWSPDGTELFFVEANALMKVDVSTGNKFSVNSTATALFEHPSLVGLPAPFARYDVSPDGRKFLTVENERELPQPMLRVVEHWTARLHP